MYSDRTSGVVIPFPHAARMAAIERTRAQTFSPSRAAPRSAVWDRNVVYVRAARTTLRQTRPVGLVLALAAAHLALLLGVLGFRLF